MVFYIQFAQKVNRLKNAYVQAILACRKGRYLERPTFRSKSRPLIQMVKLTEFNFGRSKRLTSAFCLPRGTRFQIRSLYGSTKKQAPRWGACFFGGAYRIRTGDRGVADQCLSTWLLRQIHFLTYIIIYALNR